MLKLVLAVAFIALVAAEPITPVWPESFKMDFNETNKVLILKGHTHGTYVYDAVNKKTRMDRANGKFDRYCGSVYKLHDTPVCE
jgi:hypothetical protein